MQKSHKPIVFASPKYFSTVAHTTESSRFKNLYGKGSEAHLAAIVGDTIGDPFKDTAGPSLHVLVKLMATLSLVLAGLFI